jgi:hypothetical protein
MTEGTVTVMTAAMPVHTIKIAGKARGACHPGTRNSAGCRQAASEQLDRRCGHAGATDTSHFRPN